MKTTLFLSNIIDLITVNGQQHELSTWQDITGLTREEIISTVHPNNITEDYTDYYSPEPSINDYYDEDDFIITDQDRKDYETNIANGDLPF